MSVAENKGILLESGTNELEIVEFGIQESRFAINVIKVREIVNPVKLTKLPQGHSCVEGIITIRGEVLPVIDLAKALGYPPSDHPAHDKLIVAEFNQMKMVFHVQSVYRIHRISWEQIEKPAGLTMEIASNVTGIVKQEDRIILLLDFEKIVVDISPHLGINIGRLKTLGERERSDKKIIVAEDSVILRKLLQETLTEAGYANLDFFNDGKIAWSHLEQLAENNGEELTKRVQLVITDIEMPQMDGHHLTKRIKEHKILGELPVIIFSSLITDDLKHKGNAVGADAQVSKPEIAKLVTLIDSLIL